MGLRDPKIAAEKGGNFQFMLLLHLAYTQKLLFIAAIYAKIAEKLWEICGFFGGVLHIFP